MRGSHCTYYTHFKSVVRSTTSINPLLPISFGEAETRTYFSFREIRFYGGSTGGGGVSHNLLPSHATTQHQPNKKGAKNVEEKPSWSSHVSYTDSASLT